MNLKHRSDNGVALLAIRRRPEARREGFEEERSKSRSGRGPRGGGEEGSDGVYKAGREEQEEVRHGDFGAGGARNGSEEGGQGVWQEV